MFEQCLPINPKAKQKNTKLQLKVFFHRYGLATLKLLSMYFWIDKIISQYIVDNRNQFSRCKKKLQIQKEKPFGVGMEWYQDKLTAFR